MKGYNLDFLNNKTVINIYNISICEKKFSYSLSDSLVLKLIDNSLVQILIDYDIKVYQLSSIEELIILGDYDLKSGEIQLLEISEIMNTQKITTIYNYLQSTYQFGSKFLSTNNEFIFGFCFGWDEIILLDEKDFITMLNSYDEKTEIVIPQTPDESDIST